MRMFKRLGAVFAILALLGVVVTASASAAEKDALFLFTKTGFTIKGGAGTLATLGNPFTITCTAVKGSGNTGGNETETFTATFEFTGCNANSLGDAAKVILFKVSGLLCLISTTTLEVGLFMEVTETVHLENVPIAGLVEFLAKSSDVAAITQDGLDAKEFEAKLTTSGTGDQKVGSCKDLEKTLTPAIKALIAHAGSEADGAITTSATITSEVLGTIDG
jgi:hypothetical protein